LSEDLQFSSHNSKSTLNNISHVSVIIFKDLWLISYYNDLCFIFKSGEASSVIHQHSMVQGLFRGNSVIFQLELKCQHGKCYDSVCWYPGYKDMCMKCRKTLMGFIGL